MLIRSCIQRLSLAWALVAVLLPAHDARAEEAKPNIVFILMDNLGYGEVGIYDPKADMFSIEINVCFVSVPDIR
jgi:hypothetical protein